MSAVHVVPRDDLIDHAVSDECPCGPTAEAVKRDDGSVGWLMVHHSLDGREVSENPTPPETRCCTSHHFEGCTDGGPGCCARCPINPTADEGASA